MAKPIQQHRADNRFELRSFILGPNSADVVVSMRDVPQVPNVSLSIPEGLFSDDEMDQVIAALSLLEKKAEQAYASWESTPAAAVQATVQMMQATEAKRLAELEQAAVEAATIVKREHLADLSAEAERVASSIIDMRATMEKTNG